ncbi:MAG: molybdopterin cofactor-binding domain-containing protein, partial [Candidatus Saccharibacteria bacterium]
VEVEYDTSDHSYRLIQAATVIDAGKVINPRAARGLITGGMCMGLGLGSRESFNYGADATVLNTSLRTYKPMRFGETPEYLVEFIETPQIDAPYGARGIGEHGIIGIPAALANALSRAAQVEINELPIIPELIWSLKGRNRE